VKHTENLSPKVKLSSAFFETTFFYFMKESCIIHRTQIMHEMSFLGHKLGMKYPSQDINTAADKMFGQPSFHQQDLVNKAMVDAEAEAIII